MKIKISKKFIKILSALVPNLSDLKFYLVSILLCLVISTLFVLFYINGQDLVEAQSAAMETSRIDNTMDGAFSNLSAAFGGQLFNCFYENTPIGKTSGNYVDCSDSSINPESVTSLRQGTYAGSLLWTADGGAIGRVVNMSGALATVKVSRTGETFLYYASQARNIAYAQQYTEDIQAGRNVLAPIFYLYNTMKDFALSIIVIVLLFGGLNILISNLTFNESKINFVQLFMNTGVTTVIILLYYEIAAIIYDLTVNYGNALVASVLSNYINARVVLERLSPGGDLGIMALFGTMYFVGANEALIKFVEAISVNFEPILYQTTSAFMTTAGGSVGSVVGLGSFNVLGSALGTLNGFVVGIAIPAIKYALSSKPLYDAVVALLIFVTQFKVLIMLITAYITFIVSTGFGPLFIVGAGVNEGWERGILPSLKALIANGLVFPLTFMFILLAAISFNIYIRTDNTKGADNKELVCLFGPDANFNSRGGIIDNAGVEFDAASFERNYTYGQRIFDTVPAYINQQGYRSCFTALFPLPFLVFPAPIGVIGPPTEQPMIVTSLVMFFLGIGFITAAAKAKDLSFQLVGAEEKFKDFFNPAGQLKDSFKNVLQAGAVAGGGLAFGAKFLSSNMGNVKTIIGNLPGAGRVVNGINSVLTGIRWGRWLRSWMTGSRKLGERRNPLDDLTEMRDDDLTGAKGPDGRRLTVAELRELTRNKAAARKAFDEGRFDQYMDQVEDELGLLTPQISNLKNQIKNIDNQIKIYQNQNNVQQVNALTQQRSNLEQQLEQARSNLRVQNANDPRFGFREYIYQQAQLTGQSLSQESVSIYGKNMNLPGISVLSPESQRSLYSSPQQFTDTWKKTLESSGVLGDAFASLTKKIGELEGSIGSVINAFSQLAKIIDAIN